VAPCFRQRLPLSACCFLAACLNLVILWENRLAALGLHRYYSEMIPGEKLPILTEVLLTGWWWPSILFGWFLLIALISGLFVQVERLALISYVAAWSFLLELSLLTIIPYAYYLPAIR
jgi:hypothetical protein